MFLRFNLLIERGERREKGRERNINVWLPLVCPLQGTQPATQACALTGNRTGDPLLHKPSLSPLSHPSQGVCVDFKKSIFLSSFHPSPRDPECFLQASSVSVVILQEAFPPFSALLPPGRTLTTCLLLLLILSHASWFSTRHPYAFSEHACRSALLKRGFVPE